MLRHRWTCYWTLRKLCPPMKTLPTDEDPEMGLKKDIEKDRPTTLIIFGQTTILKVVSQINIVRTIYHYWNYIIINIMILISNILHIFKNNIFSDTNMFSSETRNCFCVQQVEGAPLLGSSRGNTNLMGQCQQAWDTTSSSSSYSSAALQFWVHQVVLSIHWTAKANNSRGLLMEDPFMM